MPTGLLFECDEQVASYIFDLYKQPPMKFDKAIGLVSHEGKLLGGILFQCWNGHNVELSYYGDGTMTPGIIRCIARISLTTFNVSRVTVTTGKRNKRFIKSLQKIGFRLEGAQRCYYGARDCTRNTAVRFVMFRDRIEQIARLTPGKPTDAHRHA